MKRLKIKLILTIVFVNLFLLYPAYSDGSETELMQAEAYLHQGDIQDALPLLETLANQRNASACAILGGWYLEGRKVAIDYAKAKHYALCAAKQGNRQGQVNMGYMLHLGLGVKKDQARANHWFKLAAAQGSAAAMLNLANAYFFGYAVAVDQAKAEQLYTQAAELGSINAQTRLGYLYAVGDIQIKKDLEKSYMWLTVAAHRGNKSAALALGPLSKRMTPSQLSQAKKQATYHIEHDTIQSGIISHTNSRG